MALFQTGFSAEGVETNTVFTDINLTEKVYHIYHFRTVGKNVYKRFSSEI